MRKVMILILLCIFFLPFIANAKSKYLYDVLKNEAETSGLTKEYTGEHHDSFTEEPFKKIYYWTAPSNNDERADQILNKNNVIFANHCWQTTRTTDTGGVKMIYNGEVEDGKCLNTRENHLGYSPAGIQTLSDTYYYGTDYTYDKTNHVFSLSGTISTGEIKQGEYTCKSTSIDTCPYLYYVDSFSSETKYNVIPINSNSHYSQFGRLQYNQLSNSPAYVGYMYNKVYPASVKSNIHSFSFRSMARNSNYYYSDKIEYNTTVPNKYTLVNPKLISSLDDYSDLIGKYTLVKTNSDESSSNARYIVGINGNYIYYKELINGDLTVSLWVGDSYSKYDDYYYVIDNPTEITYSDWYNGEYNNSKEKYVCDVPDYACHNIRHITKSASNTSYYYWGVEHTYNYGESVDYNGETYTLSGDVQSIWDLSDLDERSKLSTHHYTCLNSNNSCSDINYVYFYSSNLYSISTMYPNLALQDMLSSDDVNKVNSTIKSGLDAWYKHYLLDYSDYIEDTIYCNDRNVFKLGGWDPNGGIVGAGDSIDENGTTTTNASDLKFNLYSNYRDIACKGDVNQFSVSNPKAKLTYPIGLMSIYEWLLPISLKLRSAGQNFWVNGPVYFSSSSINDYVDDLGYYRQSSVSNSCGVRPAISLKSNAKVISGDGSTSDPFQLSFDPVYSVSAQIVNETSDLIIEIDDLSKVEEGEIVKFKVKPIKGYKVNSIKILDEDNNEINYSKTENTNEYNFTMPASNVTIIPSYEKVANAVNVEDNNNSKEIVIQVNDSKAVVYEDTVRFTIIPEDGYEVESIKITDKNNNKIKYRKTKNKYEYEFTMPDTDVTIKPVYRKIESKNDLNTLINPNTGGIFLPIIVFIMIISLVIGIFTYKNKVIFR